MYATCECHHTIYQGVHECSQAGEEGDAGLLLLGQQYHTMHVTNPEAIATPWTAAEG